MKTSAAPFAGKVNDDSTKRVRCITVTVVNQMGPVLIEPLQTRRSDAKKRGVYLGERDEGSAIAFPMKAKLEVLIHGGYCGVAQTNYI